VDRNKDDEGQRLAARGYQLQVGGQLGEAIEVYQEALALDSKLAQVWYNLGSACRHLGRFDQAIAAYQQAVSLQPNDPAGWNNLGLARRDRGDLEGAIAAFRRVQDLDPSLPAAQVNLGNALRDSGRRDAAIDAYRRAIAGDPGLVAAHFNLHAALYRQSDPRPAEEALVRALELEPAHEGAAFHLAALRHLHQGDDGGLMASLPRRCDFLVDSYQFVAGHRGPGTRLCSDTFAVLRFAFAQARDEGLVIELGVRCGTSIRFIAGLCPTSPVHGFDAFEGLPEHWGPQPHGLYSTDGVLPEVPSQVTLHAGWFADTLPSFISHHGEPVRFINVDCDLYSSAHTALELLGPQIVPGSVLVFDEYLCNPGWREDEHRAFTEAARVFGWRYDYIVFSLFTKQAAVRITTVGPA
jgi:Flp pilus assembly protein TadD